MKKIILLLSIIATCFSVMGQDIIVKKSNEAIKVKVLEVNQDNIKYKKWDNQDGPTYTISKADISSIVYQNGDAEAFNVEPKKSANTTSVKKDEYIEGYCSHISFKSKAIKYDGYVIGNIDGLDDETIGNKIQNGELTFFEEKKEFLNFLKQCDNDAYHKMKQGTTLETFGLITATASLLPLIVAFVCGNDISENDALICVGTSVILVGAGLAMYFPGRNIQIKKVPQLYNDHLMRRNTSSMSLNIGIVGAGVGFSLKF